MEDKDVWALVARLEALIRENHMTGAHMEKPYNEPKSWRECHLPMCRRFQYAWDDKGDYHQ